MSVPAPLLVRAGRPSVPAKVSAAALLTVKVAAAPLTVTVPLPVTEATCCGETGQVEGGAGATDSAVAVGRALVAPSASVPALTWWCRV